MSVWFFLLKFFWDHNIIIHFSLSSCQSFLTPLLALCQTTASVFINRYHMHVGREAQEPRSKPMTVHFTLLLSGRMALEAGGDHFPSVAVFLVTSEGASCSVRTMIGQNVLMWKERGEEWRHGLTLMLNWSVNLRHSAASEILLPVFSGDWLSPHAMFEQLYGIYEP